MAETTRSFSQLIVIGASAGGIEALSTVVSNVPEDMPAPIVVAQHLSPHRASTLADILSRRTSLPVQTVKTTTALMPGVIYVVPPNRNVSITDHEVRVHENADIGPHPSIDLLFRSAAQVFREELIAVVLSGTGSDGAAGAREVKQLGGTVVIQNPETASFPGMPLSLAPSTVDIVANPDAIGPLLHDLLTGVFQVPRASEDSQFRGFLDQLREETGIDFSTYKQATISRRLQRRMAATGKTSLADYMRYLNQQPDERRRLVGSFLIKVTEFFRDPELFTYLREQVLPELIAEARQRDGELRLWSAGCATGEEAYSLAILVADLLEETEGAPPVRIFATDLDAEAVAFARRGIYPARSLATIPEEMLERYFAERNGEYEVKKPLRSMLVFGEHDLGQRAPFPRIDLILCRNVLIYFTAALQRRALQLFAFSLRPAGYLVLGKSETVSPLAEYFALDQSRLKVFRRVGDRALIPPGRIRESMPLAMPPVRNPARRQPASMPPRDQRPGRDPLRARSGSSAESVLLILPVGVVVIDQNYDIQSINAAARRLLGIHSAAIDRDFLHLLQHIPIPPLRRAIDEAFAERTDGELLLSSEGNPSASQPRTLRIQCYPLDHRDEFGTTSVAVTIMDATDVVGLQHGLESAQVQTQRLLAENEEVLAANLELTTIIARLRAENDELLVSTEEIQAATEEVETLNEELQASNEELETLNEELQATVEELNTTNDDLQARTVELQEMAIIRESARARLETILASMSEAVLVVDETGRPVLANAAYERMFGGTDQPLIPEGDDGRPLFEEEHPLRRAARGETSTLAFTLTSADGRRRWYEAETRPMPGESPALGVVTIRDISERSLRHLQDQWLAIAGHELRTPIAALKGHLQLARRRSHELSDPTFPDRLDRALGQVDRISQLIDQMVDASRFQFGRITMSFEPTDLVSIIDRVIESSRLMPGETEIIFDRPEAQIELIADAGRLEQALSNLVTNAILHASGQVTVTIGVRQLPETIEITVADNGPGIAPDVLPLIFDRFTQGAGIKAGLGLGLFICREIITDHGGTISVSSTPNVGTTFTVRLPITPPGISTDQP